MSENRITVLLVDDEFYARQSLRKLLSADPEVEIAGECANGKEAIQAIREVQPDLLFLDIQMPEINGFDVLQQLSPEELPYIIFSTAFDQYALKAFEVNALDYLLKPYSDDRFFEALNKAKTRIHAEEKSSLQDRFKKLLDHLPQSDQPKEVRIAVRHRERVILLSASEIDWVESADQYVNIHTSGKAHLLRESMSQMEEKLSTHGFFRTHRSALVNVSRIRELELHPKGECALFLQDNTRIRLARNRKEALEAILGI